MKIFANTFKAVVLLGLVVAAPGAMAGTSKILNFGGVHKTSQFQFSALSKKRIKTNTAAKSGLQMTQSQVFGARCSTPAGWCTIQPQPVGSPCLCGQVKGVTWQ